MRIWVLAAALVCLNSPGSAAGELTGTLKHIADTGVIHLGFREAEPPMSFLNKSGQPIGYSIDLCNHIAAAVKQKIGRTDIAVEFVPVTAETRFTSIESGAIDILCGATTKTLGRSERVDFTQLTFMTGASLLSLDTTKVQGIMSLKGKRVAVVENTTTIEALEYALKARLVDAEVVSVSSSADQGKGHGSGRNATRIATQDAALTPRPIASAAYSPQTTRLLISFLLPRRR